MEVEVGPRQRKQIYLTREKPPKRLRYERNTMTAMKHIATIAELRIMRVYFPYSGADV